jgi:hypothetical protein
MIAPRRRPEAAPPSSYTCDFPPEVNHERSRRPGAQRRPVETQGSQPFQGEELHRRPVGGRRRQGDDQRRQPRGQLRRGHGAQLRRGGDQARHRGGPQGAARLGEADRPGALEDPAQVVRPHGRQRRRPGADPHHRAGQAALGGQGRDHVRRFLHRVVRRGSQARLRRCDPEPHRGQAHHRDQAAGRRGGCHHAVELPQRDDHAQGRPGWPWRSWRSAPAFRRASSTSSPAARAPSAAR